MITSEEAAHAIEGMLRLARFDRHLGEGFGRDYAACGRSFFAYVLALPVILWLCSVEGSTPEVARPGLLMFANGLSFVIETAGFPLLLLFVLKVYGRADRWAWFVTGYNWFNATQLTFLVSVAALGKWPALVAQIYVLVLEAFLAEAMLEIGGFRAAGIVLLDVFFGLGVDAVGRWIGTGVFSFF